LVNSTKKKSLGNLITQYTFDNFSGSVSKSKNLTVTDIFAKQLLQMPTCTGEKVAAILNLYSTPKQLMTSI